MADSKKYDGGQWEHSLRKLTTATDTLTTLPADLYADGTNATIGLKGNTVQNGTPSPSNPVDVDGVGDRTNNLCPMSFSHTGVADDNGGVTTTNTRLWTEMIPVSASTNYYVTIDGKASNDEILRFNRAIQYDASGTFISRINTGANTSATFTTSANCAYIVLDIRTMSLAVNLSETDVNTIQMNRSSTALPYEPYGYKIPISSANTTTPVYLGEVQTTRKIKKYEFTGQESDLRLQQLITATNAIQAPTTISNYKRSPFICSHMEVTSSSGESSTHGFYGQELTLCFALSMGLDTLEKARTYLQQQYANGTPVTVWYVLATPTTGIVNEPIRKIGDYADTVSGITIPTITGKDTVDIETTLKPSEVELTYTGWHDATVKEWDGSDWQ